MSDVEMGQSVESAPLGDHPHSDPGDGRSECQTCGKWVWLVTHSCKGVPVTQAAMDRRFPPGLPTQPTDAPDASEA